MAQRLTDIQQQTEAQLLRQAPLQTTIARLMELSVTELEDRVKNEMVENVALEEGREPANDDTSDDDMSQDADDREADVSDESTDLDSLYDSDDIPVHVPSASRTEEREMPLGASRSFIDDLLAQIGEFDVTNRQRIIIEYLIGTLNNRGFIDRPLSTIAEDLLFSRDFEASPREMEASLRILQQFDPPGIGARDLQECLLIQINRQLEATHDNAKRQLLKLERSVITDHFDLFEQQNAEALAEVLSAPLVTIQNCLKAIARLDPRPGSALSEVSDGKAQSIVPDFVVETTPEGVITVELNRGAVPNLRVSEDYLAQILAYERTPKRFSRSTQEAYEFAKRKVESAVLFVNGMRQRYKMLLRIAKAIVHLQRDFVLSLDESQLHAMRLVDVAKLAKTDASYVSRARKNKYMSIDGQLFPLDYFFFHFSTNAQGEEYMGDDLRRFISEIIDSEDKTHPLSDQAIMEQLKQRNVNVSRRTIAKYRLKMNIPGVRERMQK